MSWEVRTMKSATSSSKPGRFYPALWKKNMARFWPLWAVFWVFWLFLAPLTLLTQDAEATLHYTDSFALSGPAYFAQITLLDLLSTAGVFSALIFGSLSAMAVFSYLYSSRSVDFFHALPVKKQHRTRRKAVALVSVWLHHHLAGIVIFQHRPFVLLYHTSSSSQGGALA